MKTLISTLFFVFSIVSLPWVNACEKHQRIDQLMEVTGIKRQLSDLSAMMDQVIYSKKFDDLDMTKLTDNFHRVIDTQAILVKTSQVLADKLNDSEVAQLLDWYKEPLAKRLLDSKEAAYKFENLMFISENSQTILDQGQDRIRLIEDINKALKLNTFIDDMQATLKAVVMVTIHQQLGMPKPWNIALFPAEIETDQQASIKQIVDAASVYIYRDFTLDELNELKSFSVNSANVKCTLLMAETFRQVVNSRIEALIAESDSDIPQALSTCNCCCSGN